MADLINQFKNYFRAFVKHPSQFSEVHPTKICPICDYEGIFLDLGNRVQARCPNCSSKERDRLLGLHFKKLNFDAENSKILHFSAEKPFWRRWKKFPHYVAGDIKKSSVANAVVDITGLKFSDNYFDVIICNHVLEHVKADILAMNECFRVLKRGGAAYFSVPIQKDRIQSWEPPEGMPIEEIEKICGWDHVRLYGTDIADKLTEIGFEVSTVQYSDEEDALHCLRDKTSNDLVFICVKQ
ncbi:MAG: methyltransferase domain-containing protein [Pseudomonadota bacterium]